MDPRPPTRRGAGTRRPIRAKRGRAPGSRGSRNPRFDSPARAVGGGPSMGVERGRAHTSYTGSVVASTTEPQIVRPEAPFRRAAASRAWLLGPVMTAATTCGALLVLRGPDRAF